MTTEALRAVPAPSDTTVHAGTPVATITAVTALILGALGDYLLRGGPPGLGFGLWLTAIVVALEMLSRVHHLAWTPTQRMLVIPLLFFSESLAWRDSAGLAFLNLVAAGVAAAVLSTSLFRGDAWDVVGAGIRDYVRACIGTAAGAAGGAAPLLARALGERTVNRDSERTRTTRAVVRGLALALPLLFVFGGLLMSADPVFNFLITDVFSFDLESAFTHLVVALVLAWPLAGWLRGALIERTGPTLEDRPLTFSLGAVEVASILGTLDALFLAFVIVQARYLFGGEALVRATAGMTYAEYARSGFFELVFVVLLALPVILLSHELLRRWEPRAERTWRWLSGTMIALLGAVMLSALWRMRMYVRAYGLTEDRVYATAFMVWLAITFTVLAATVLRGRQRGFGFGALVAGWGTIALLDVVCPDVVIARVNLARRATVEQFDGRYLATLSAEAVPVVLRALPTVPAAQRCEMAGILRDRWKPRADRDWRSWNRARATAEALVQAQQSELQAASCSPGSPLALAVATPEWWEHVTPVPARAADATAAQADTLAISGTVAEFYGAMSYPDGQEPNWTRVRHGFTPAATVVVDTSEHAPDSMEGIQGWGGARTGLTRVELSHTITLRGRHAQVASVYETRRTRDGLVFGEGTALFELLRGQDGRWRIAALAWDPESPQIADSPAAH